MGWGGGREVREGEDIGIHIADSFHCTAETNIVKRLYFNNKTKINKLSRALERLDREADILWEFEQ